MSTKRAVNRVTLVGTIGRHPQVFEDANGTKVAALSVATPRTHLQARAGVKAADGERTDWHRVKFYGSRARFAENHLDAGVRVYLEGELQYDSYERDGVVIPTATIAVTEVVVLSTPVPEGSEDR